MAHFENRCGPLYESRISKTDAARFTNGAFRKQMRPALRMAHFVKHPFPNQRKSIKSRGHFCKHVATD